MLWLFFFFSLHVDTYNYYNVQDKSIYQLESLPCYCKNLQVFVLHIMRCWVKIDLFDIEYIQIHVQVSVKKLKTSFQTR